MPRGVAKRMERVNESGTVKITDAVARLRKEGSEVISFSVGEPDFDTPANVREAAKRALDEGKTRYTSAWGLPELREAIAKKSRDENGIPAQASNVLVSPAKQAIFYAILTLVDEGDDVLLPDPAWVSYEPVIRLAGGNPVHVTADITTDFRMTPEAVLDAITPDTKMLITNSPSNPTGGVATIEDVRGWTDLARDHDFHILSDELYEKILYDGHHHSPASLPGAWERTLTVNGLSKSHAMTGWRVGWLVGDAPIMKEIIKLQQHSLTHPTTFTQHAALEALRMDPAPIRAMVQEFRARRDLLVAGLRDIPGWRCNEPKGAFYVFAKYHHEVSSMEMAERLLMDGGVAVTPGIEFGPGGEGHVRISYANSRDNITRGLEKLREVSAKLPR